MSPRKQKAPPKRKAVAYALIDKESDSGREPYGLLGELIAQHHQDLYDASIALAWNLSWKPDIDGRVTLGKCKKASDLDRELVAYDFIILLRQEFWRHPMVTDQQRRALLDHELCHAAVSFDEDGEPKTDVRGRKVYRIRKHDLEEFAAIAERYGCWKKDLESFAAALRRGSHQEPLPLDDARAAAARLDRRLREDGTTAALSAGGETLATFGARR